MIKKGIIYLILTVSTFLFFSACHAEEKNISVFAGLEAGYCFLSGDTLITKGGEPGTGTRMDFDNDLGLDNNFTFKPFLGLELFKKHKIGFSFMPMQFKGNNVLSGDEIFRNVLFLKNTSIETKFDIDLYELRYSYNMIRNDTIIWYLSVGSCLYNMRWTIDGISSGADVTVDRKLTQFFPAIGSGIGLYMSSKCSLDLFLEGMVLDNDQSYLGVKARLNYDINRNISVNTGAEFSNVSFARSTNNGKLQLLMPFLGGKINF